MSEPGRHTAPTVLDIPVSVTGLSVFTDPTPTAIVPVISFEPEQPTEIYPHFAEIPEPIPHHMLTTDDTNLITVAPSFDWTHSEAVGYQLQVRMTDLEAWLQLREKYGSPNNLIALINSDRIVLGQDGPPFPYVEEIS